MIIEKIKINNSIDLTHDQESHKIDNYLERLNNSKEKFNSKINSNNTSFKTSLGLKNDGNTKTTSNTTANHKDLKDDDDFFKWDYTSIIVIIY